MNQFKPIKKRGKILQNLSGSILAASNIALYATSGTSKIQRHQWVSLRLLPIASAKGRKYCYWPYLLLSEESLDAQHPAPRQHLEEVHVWKTHPNQIREVLPQQKQRGAVGANWTSAHRTIAGAKWWVHFVTTIWDPPNFRSNKKKCVSNKRSIKVCVSCCWQRPGTSAPSWTY